MSHKIQFESEIIKLVVPTDTDESRTSTFSIFRTANIGQFFNGLAGAFLVQLASLVSTTWFPPYQRTTATAVSSIAMELGMAVSFILGPLVVTDFKTTL